MKPYLDESLLKRAAEKNFAPLFNEETHSLHINVHGSMLNELQLMVENDAEMLEEDFVEEQESAGYHDPPQRRAFAGHFNHLLLWSILLESSEKQEPTGAVSTLPY